jgi:hypothetical protein
MVVAYPDLLDKAFASSFRMVDDALSAIGRIPSNNAPPGALWEFPDSESRDLAGRIFGDGSRGSLLTDKLKLVTGTLFRHSATGDQNLRKQQRAFGTSRPLFATLDLGYSLTVEYMLYHRPTL